MTTCQTAVDLLSFKSYSNLSRSRSVSNPIADARKKNIDPILNARYTRLDHSTYTYYIVKMTSTLVYSYVRINRDTCTQALVSRRFLFLLEQRCYRYYCTNIQTAAFLRNFLYARSFDLKKEDKDTSYLTRQRILNAATRVDQLKTTRIAPRVETYPQLAIHQ